MVINLASTSITTTMGFGNRFVIWVRGCSNNCPGCISKDYKSHKVRNEISVHELFEQIKFAKENNNIEGISISGGEPFEQAQALAYLAKRCREIGLSVIVWSGFTLEQIRLSNKTRVLLTFADVLIDGPFVSALASDDFLRGSSNQRIHYLTSRYSKNDEGNQTVRARFEEGKVTFEGVVPYDLLTATLKALGVAE